MIYGTKESAKLCCREICAESTGYTGVFSAKTTHPGGILMDAPEQNRNATQFAGGMSRAALSGTDSHCHST